MTTTDLQTLELQGKVEQALLEEAFEIVENMQADITARSLAFRLANEGVLEMYVTLDTKSKEFFTKNHVEIEKGWSKYFQPVLENLFPQGAWSYSTIKRFRTINDTPAKKAEYLGLRDMVSDKAQSTVKKITAPETLLKGALTRVNNLLSEHAGKFHIAVKAGLLILVTPKPLTSAATPKGSLQTAVAKTK